MDSQKLVSGGDDMTAIVWSIDYEKNIATLEGHQGTIFTAVFFARDTKVAMGVEINL